MIQFREISLREAMDMIVDGEIEDLYFQRSSDVVKVVNYQTPFGDIEDYTYFRKEIKK